MKLVLLKITLVSFLICWTSQFSFAKSWKAEVDFPQLKTKLKLKDPWRKIAQSQGHALLKGRSYNQVESVALIRMTDLKPHQIDPNAMRINANNYISAKAKEVTAQDGVLLSPEPFLTNYNSKSSKSKATYYSAGLRYQLGGHHYSERAYFIQCPSQVLVVKTLTESRAPASESLNLVRGLQCY